MARRIIRLLPLLLVALVTACGGPVLTGVGSVEILGGDRSVPLAATALLTPLVTAGSGVATTVTWTSSNEAAGIIDDGGVLTAVGLGSTTVTATSTADATKSDSVIITVDQPTLADGAFLATVSMSPGAPPAVGAALSLLDSSPPVVTSLSTVIDIGSGLYSGPVSPMNSDGTVVVKLPLGSDLPDETFATASEFLYNLEGVAGCSLVASAPTVRVTEAGFEIVTVPGVILYTADGSIVAMATNMPIDLGTPPEPEVLADLEFLTWVFAEAPVSINTSGAGCATATPAVGVDIDLAQGWNRLAWSLEMNAVTHDIEGISLGHSSTTDVFVAGF